MSIYISGIEMPSHGSITLTIRADGFVQQQKEKPDYEPPVIGKAVRVQASGRLIEADTLYEDCVLDSSIDVMATTKRINEYMALKIDEAPTIIPPEEKLG